MTRILPAFTAAATAALLLAGCSTARSFSTPVEVTRFSAPQINPAAIGPVGLEFTDGAFAGPGVQSPTADIYLSAVAQEMRALGFEVTNNNAPTIAIVSFERFTLQAEKRSPVTVGGGASVGSYGSGAGLGIGIDLSGPDPDTVDTQLSVRIRPRTEGETLWEGRARFAASANNELADEALAAQRLASALFTGFPGQSGETIEVE